MEKRIALYLLFSKFSAKWAVSELDGPSGPFTFFKPDRSLLAEYFIIVAKITLF